jgi:alpha-aminoadipic semialdehyde synthase
MAGCIGIRREDKNRWERRAPLVPEDVRGLVRDAGVGVVVQPSPVRVYAEGDYRAAGARVDEDLSGCDAVLAVKEIPADLLRPGGTYVFFSHTIKGQQYNMAMLGKLMELGCTLIDYELIMDEAGLRTVFFGVHAGLAGMTETLVALGRRLGAEGIGSPFAAIRQPHEYPDLGSVKQAVRAAGERIAGGGLPPGCAPLVFGLAGYGNVSRGAQEILDELPVIGVAPADLAGLERAGASERHVYKVVFREEHMVEPISGGFDLGEYYDHPERYRSTFARHLDHLDVLVNCIYWTERYPRLLTRQDARRLAPGGKLRVVGDLSCDIGGAVEITLKATMPDEPCFTYDPATDAVADGVTASGIVVMAVDNLPCEIPKESSASFSRALRSLVPAIAGADWSRDLDELEIPGMLRDAIIVHRGRLVPRFSYLEEAVRSARG